MEGGHRVDSSVAGAEINWASPRRETCRKLLRNDIQTRADREKARALELARLLDEPFQLDKVWERCLAQPFRVVLEL